MQAIPQDLSFLIAGLMQGGGVQASSFSTTQVVDAQLESDPSEFISVFQESLQGLINGDPAALANPNLLHAIETLLGQSQDLGGNSLPLAVDSGEPGLDDFATQIIPGFNASQLDNLARLFRSEATTHAGPSITAISLDTQARMLGPTDLALLQGRIVSPPQAKQAALLPIIDSPVAIMSGTDKSVDPVMPRETLVQNFDPVQVLKQLELKQGMADDSRQQQDFKKLTDNLTRKPEMSDFVQKLALAEQRMPLPIDGLTSAELKSDIGVSGQPLQANKPTGGSLLATDVRPAQAFIQSPVGASQWQKEFTNRIVWLARDGVQSAEIRLNPAHLGPIEVKVVMRDDMASITMTAQHQAVRDAMESALPRLREMFSATGLHLADAHVSDQSLHQQHNRHSQNMAHDSNAGSRFAKEEVATDALVSELILHQSKLPPGYSSGLDLYA